MSNVYSQIICMFWVYVHSKIKGKTTSVMTKGKVALQGLKCHPLCKIRLKRRTSDQEQRGPR